MSHDPLILQKLDQILWCLERLTNQGTTTMSTLDDLKAQVAQTLTVEASAKALIDGLAAKLSAALAAGDMTAVAGLVSELQASASGLAADVVANTPAAPATAAAAPPAAPAAPVV